MTGKSGPEEPIKDVLKGKTKTTRHLLPGGFAGSGPHGSFFESPAWVDPGLAPGLTSQDPVVPPQPGWWRPFLTGEFLFFSPNLVWLTIALAVYAIFPYDLQAAQSLQQLDWVLYRCIIQKKFCHNFSFRFVVNFCLTFCYYGFWHCGLYQLGWCKRPFQPARSYRAAKVGHSSLYMFFLVYMFTYCTCSTCFSCST